MSAMALRIIACVSMLLDHIGFAFNINILRIIGRLAFPLYLYLLYNGYKHSSNRVMYAVRLGIFAIISQIPFSLFTEGELLCANGNVFVTLFICLICIWITDAMLRNNVAKWVAFLPTAAVFSMNYLGFINSDYGEKGVLMAFVFTVFYGKGYMRKILTVLGVLCSVFYAYILDWVLLPVLWIFGKDPGIPTLSMWQMVQVFSLLALPLIFLYNGQKGKWPIGKPKAQYVKYGFYAFYPAHLLVLWLVAVVINALM